MLQVLENKFVWEDDLGKKDIFDFCTLFRKTSNYFLSVLNSEIRYSNFIIELISNHQYFSFSWFLQL